MNNSVTFQQVNDLLGIELYSLDTNGNVIINPNATGLNFTSLTEEGVTQVYFSHFKSCLNSQNAYNNSIDTTNLTSEEIENATLETFDDIAFTSVDTTDLNNLRQNVTTRANLQIPLDTNNVQGIN